MQTIELHNPDHLLCDYIPITLDNIISSTTLVVKSFIFLRAFSADVLDLGRMCN